jgi:uracil-DNA glycosylase
MPWWNNEIDIINPKIIILLGEKAVKSLKIINIEKYDFAYLLNRQGEEIKIGNKYLIRFVLPHPSAPYKEKELPNRTKSEIYKQVFSQIKDILKR